MEKEREREKKGHERAEAIPRSWKGEIELV